MSPLSPAYFAFAAIVVTLYWACYRWKLARLCILLSANIFFLARLAWFYPILLLAAASIDFLVGLGPAAHPTRTQEPPPDSRLCQRRIKRRPPGRNQVHPRSLGRTLSLGLPSQPLFLLFPVNDLHH